MKADIYGWMNCSKPIAIDREFSIEDIENIAKRHDIMIVSRGDGKIIIYTDEKGRKFKSR